MKKRTVQFFTLFLILCVITACYKRNFYEDPNNPGLSRFTSRDYDVASAYINNQPWVTGYFNNFKGPYPSYILLNRDTTAKDTLNIIWQGNFDNDTVFASKSWYRYRNVIVSIPVNKGFSVNDFLSWNGKVF